MVLSWHSSGPSSKVHPAPQISTGSFHKGGNGLVMAFLWTFLKGASSSTDLNREFSQGRQWSCHGIPLDLPQRCIQLHRSQQGVFHNQCLQQTCRAASPHTWLCRRTRTPSCTPLDPDHCILSPLVCNTFSLSHCKPAA